MGRSTTIWQRLLVLALFSLAMRSVAQQAPTPASNEVVIKNAMVMTVTHGNIKNGSV